MDVTLRWLVRWRSIPAIRDIQDEKGGMREALLQTCRFIYEGWDR